MIHDELKNWRRYATPGTHLYSAFEWLATKWNPAMPDGRVDVVGDDVFALIQGYPTRAEADCRFESHRKYLDIQFVHDGAEGMGWAPVESLEVSDPHSDEKDVAFFRQPAIWSRADVRAGQFTVFYPEDAHEPGIRIEGASAVKKVVMKVRC